MRESVIVVLHYANDALTNQCVESILKTTDWHKVQILVVDNFSPTPYEDHTGGKIMVMRNDNREVVNGMNFGFYHALYSVNFKPKYIINLDNDVICLDGWYDPLIKEFDDETVGIVGGKQWDKKRSHFRGVGLDLVGGMLWLNGPTNKQEVLYIQGSCVAMRADMMRMIGLHDTRFKTVCSDSDYCFHARDRGWKVVFTPDSEVIHIQNASITSVADSWSSDNRELIRKWCGAKSMGWLAHTPLDSRTNKYIRTSFEIFQDNSKEPIAVEASDV